MRISIRGLRASDKLIFTFLDKTQNVLTFQLMEALRLA
ncbi:hypothetical protein DFP78_11230 [Photobacterium lutimaris]|nr:hypothetical protein DFP78_11230 [Photobacterium lutimaris]